MEGADGLVPVPLASHIVLRGSAPGRKHPAATSAHSEGLESQPSNSEDSQYTASKKCSQIAQPFSGAINPPSASVLSALCALSIADSSPTACLSSQGVLTD